MIDELAPRRWRPSPFLLASAALHAGTGAAALVQPRIWPWALGAVAVNHVALTAAGLWPKSRLLGSNWTHLPAPSAGRGEVAITIDDGPDPSVTPQVLALLASRGVHASFFCVGERVERFPALARELVRRGHTIENHSQRHRHSFSLMGPRSIRAELGDAQRSIERITGCVPTFFRAPAGLRNPFLDPVLCAMRLQLTSWTHRGFDTVDRSADAVYRRLARALGAGDILLLHDGHAARGRDGVPVILEVLPRLLEALRLRGLRPVTLREALA